jgi:uncharacterized protein YjgD (DUF1641 family)
MSMEATRGPDDAGSDAQTRRRAEGALAALVETGDLDRLVQLARVVGSAQDALSDDIVSRLAGTAADGLDLLDRVNRSGIARALPAITALVETGDLDRLVQLARVVGSAQDAVSDDIVSRLAGTAADSLDLLDRVNRSGIARALPAIAALSEAGDLDRLVQLARVVGSAQDALSDDIVSRLADLATRAICLIDRVTRDDAIGRLLDLVERGSAIQVLGDFFECLDRAGRDAQEGPPASGGIGGLWALMKQKENQETLRFMLAVARQLRAGCIARSTAVAPPPR